MKYSKSNISSLTKCYDKGRLDTLEEIRDLITMANPTGTNRLILNSHIEPLINYYKTKNE